MRYIELIQDNPLVWGLFFAYVIATTGLAWLGHRRTAGMRSFAVGDGDMSAFVVGLTLAASLASTATFVLNPGFVYVHGLSALIHLGGAVGLGLIVGLVSMSFGFRRIGARTSAVTIPQWIGERYGSTRLATFFAGVNLLSLSFVVLIVGSISIVMQRTLGLSNTESLVLTVTFVFGYVFLGGTYAHAYTNTLQAAVMLVVSSVIIWSGLHHLTGGPVLARLAATDPNLTAAVNPASNLFGNVFSVYISGFVVGFALICQPHILSKALYVKDDRTVRRYLAIAIAVSVLFSGLLLVGLYAHLADIPRSAFLDAQGNFRQDAVMTAYLTHTFSPTVLAIITVAILAAGMSTLDGILVALSSIAGNDLFLNLARRHLPADMDEAGRQRLGHRASQLILIGIGIAAFLIALDPPRLLGIFGQVGVYGIVAASTVPILFGIFFADFDRRSATAAAVAGLAVHFALYAFGDPARGFANPGVTATLGIFVSVAATLPWAARRLLAGRRARAARRATTG